MRFKIMGYKIPKARKPKPIKEMIICNGIEDEEKSIESIRKEYFVQSYKVLK